MRSRKKRSYITILANIKLLIIVILIYILVDKIVDEISQESENFKDSKTSSILI